MDSFVEQIVSKKAEAKDIVKRWSLIIGGSFVAFLVVMAVLITGFAFIILLAFGAIWLSWFLAQDTFIEYEYIVTNNELDIDKIMARKKRKRLITIRIDKAEEWGEYAEGKGSNAAVTVQAHDCGYKNLWYILVHHDKHGKLMLLFSPNRNVLEVINKNVPYALRKKELKDAGSDSGSVTTRAAPKEEEVQ